MAAINPFLQFTDRAKFQQLLSRAGTKAGPPRLVSPLTIAARLQHMQRVANHPDAVIDDGLDEED